SRWISLINIFIIVFELTNVKNFQFQIRRSQLFYFVCDFSVEGVFSQATYQYGDFFCAHKNVVLKIYISKLNTTSGRLFIVRYIKLNTLKKRKGYAAELVYR